MDQKELQQKIAEYYVKLPEKLQKIFDSGQWLDTLQTISEKYKLKDEHQQTLGTETSLVLLGVIPMEDYESAIRKEILIGEDKLDSMLEEVNTLILNSVRKELVEAFRKNAMDYGKSLETKTTSPTKEVIGEKQKETLASEVGAIKSEEFVSSTKNVEKIVSDSNYQSKLYAIGKANNLTIAQMSALESAISDVISGKLHAEKFEEVIKKSSIPPEKIRGVVDEINQKILGAIREKIINPNIIEAPKKEDTIETREDILKKVENPNDNDKSPTPKVMPLILAQKLGGTFQNPSVKTEYSMGSLTKANEVTMKKPDSAPISLPKKDPYRVSVEE